MNQNIKNKLKEDTLTQKILSKKHQKQIEDMDKLKCISDTGEEGYEAIFELVNSSNNLKKLFDESLQQNPSVMDKWSRYNSLLTEDRKDKICQVIDSRTNYIRVAIQDIFHKHNVSACLRSCEAFGILNVDIINTKLVGGGFKPSSASKGVERWLKLSNYKSIEDYCHYVKDMGYKIVAAYPPHYNTVNIDELSVDSPMVIAFGNEHDGLSSEWDPYIDTAYTIPMYGMVESLNISVSCGITLQTIVSRARKFVDTSRYFLSNEEKQKLMDLWLQKHFAWIK